MKFRIGDRVKPKERHYGSSWTWTQEALTDWIGTITGFDSLGDPQVKWDVLRESWAYKPDAISLAYNGMDCVFDWLEANPGA